MIMKIDAKFEEKLTLGSKNDMRNLLDFNASKSNLKSCTLISYFRQKCIIFETKKVQRSYVS